MRFNLLYHIVCYHHKDNKMTETKKIPKHAKLFGRWPKTLFFFFVDVDPGVSSASVSSSLQVLNFAEVSVQAGTAWNDCDR